MSTSDYIAGAALLISLCSLAVSLREMIRDKYKLTFDAFMLRRTGPDREFQIGVTVSNKGRRPISITDIHFGAHPGPGNFRTPIRTDRIGRLGRGTRCLRRTRQWSSEVPSLFPERHSPGMRGGRSPLRSLCSVANWLPTMARRALERGPRDDGHDLVTGYARSGEPPTVSMSRSSAWRQLSTKFRGEAKHPHKEQKSKANTYRQP
jgi:hypothetical protein